MHSGESCRNSQDISSYFHSPDFDLEPYTIGSLDPVAVPPLHTPPGILPYRFQEFKWIDE